MRAYRIYLIRHGMTDGNFEGRYLGSTDVALCDEGIYGLLQLKESHEYPNVGAVYTSPLKRCIQTAGVLFNEQTVIAIPELSEYHFGEFEGKTLAEMKEDPRYHDFIAGEMVDEGVGMENIHDFNKRIVDGLDAVIMDMMKRKISDVAVVTHGGVIAQLLAECGLPKQKASEWAVGNGRGYTLLINASLWGNTRSVEVLGAVPFDILPEAES